MLNYYAKNLKGEEKPDFGHMRVVSNAASKTFEIFLKRPGYGMQARQGKYFLELIRTDS